MLYIQGDLPRIGKSCTYKRERRPGNRNEVLKGFRGDKKFVVQGKCVFVRQAGCGKSALSVCHPSPLCSWLAR